MLAPNENYAINVHVAHLVWSGPLRQLGARRDDPAWPLLLLCLLQQWWHRLQRGGHCLHVHRRAGVKKSYLLTSQTKPLLPFALI